MALVFSISNQKGGVGKTTTAINIATYCARKNVKTLLIDLDPQGNATSGFGIDRNDLKSTIYELLLGHTKSENAILKSDYENLWIIPANSHLAAAEVELIEKSEREFVLKKLIEKISAPYELIIIDCPPSLGLLTINALTACQKLLIPLQCEYYALEGLGQLLNTFQLVQEKLNPNIEVGGVVLTMADFRTNLTQQVIEEVRKYFGEKTFETVVPRSVKISEAPSFGKPAIVYETNSKASKAYLQVGEEFMQRFGFMEKDETETKTGELETIQEPAETAPEGKPAESCGVTETQTVSEAEEVQNA